MAPQLATGLPGFARYARGMDDEVAVIHVSLEKIFCRSVREKTRPT